MSRSKGIRPRIYDIVTSTVLNKEDQRDIDEGLKILRDCVIFHIDDLMPFAIKNPFIDDFVEDGEMAGDFFAPPFDDVWLEGELDFYGTYDEENVFHSSQKTRFQGGERVITSYAVAIFSADTTEFTPSPEEIEEDIRWTMRTTVMFAFTPYGDKMSPNICKFSPSILVSSDGKAKYIGKVNTLTEEAVEFADIDEEDETDWNIACIATRMILATFALLNKGTEIETITPKRNERRVLGRLMGSKTPAPSITYHWVYIHPDKQRGSVPRPATAATAGPKKALHGVRRHPRRVGPDGLFGKGYYANQIIFIKAHKRGDSEIGTLEKGYKVYNE